MMKPTQLMFAGVFGLALAACGAPDAAPPADDSQELGTVTSAMSCECSGSPGAWYYPSGASAQEMANDLATYCPNGGTCTGNSSSNGSSTSPGDGSGSGSGTGYGSGSGTGTGTGSPGSGYGSGSGSGSGSTQPNSSNIPRDGEARVTSEHWNLFRTYHDVRSEVGFNDGDSVRFFQDLKEARTANIGMATTYIPNIPYATGVLLAGLMKLSDMQIDEIASKYQSTGHQQGIRVVIDQMTDMYTGITTNYLIYNIYDGALLGQASTIIPSLVSNDGPCQYGDYGDVQVALDYCSNNITACNAGYKCGS